MGQRERVHEVVALAVLVVGVGGNKRREGWAQRLKNRKRRWGGGDANRAPRLCQSQRGVLSSRWRQNGDGEDRTGGWDGAISPLIHCSPRNGLEMTL